jgi:hypothetical protein
MKKILLTIITLFLFAVTSYGQAALPLTFSAKSTTSGNAKLYRMGDTVYSQIISTSQYDSLIPVISTADSAYVAVTYQSIDYYAGSTARIAVSDWATNDTIKCLVDGGTTEPYGNISKAGASSLIKNPVGQYIRLRYHFVSPSPYTGQTRKSFKSWLKVYKH